MSGCGWVKVWVWVWEGEGGGGREGRCWVCWVCPRLSYTGEAAPFTRRCYTQELADLLGASLPDAAVRLTVTWPRPAGASVGQAACDRDATLLRSQLEPCATLRHPSSPAPIFFMPVALVLRYTTLQLRQRLVSSFGHAPHPMVGSPPEARAQVMARLLDGYAQRPAKSESGHRNGATGSQR